jgi:hypothetical protein
MLAVLITLAVSLVRYQGDVRLCDELQLNIFLIFMHLLFVVYKSQSKTCEED